MATINGEQWTYIVTSTAFTITADMGIKVLSMEAYSTNADDCTVLGSKTILSYPSVAVPLKKGESLTVVNTQIPIDNLVITAPSGCSVKLIGSQN